MPPIKHEMPTTTSNADCCKRWRLNHQESYDAKNRIRSLGNHYFKMHLRLLYTIDITLFD